MGNFVSPICSFQKKKLFKSKKIITKIESQESLLEKLNNDIYDFIFVSNPIEKENYVCQEAFKENLYITIPKTHFLAGMKDGVHFSEIDGQSFLVSNNLGIWDDIVAKNLPKSRFFPQEMDNLHEIISASSIPSFSTNVSLETKNDIDRISILILDQDASVTFYLVYKKQNKQKIKNFLKLLYN